MCRYTVTPENEEKMRQVAEALTGTCANVDDMLDVVFGDDAQLEDFEEGLLQTLDELAMCCGVCSWWHDPADLDDDEVCYSCRD